MTKPCVLKFVFAATLMCQRLLASTTVVTTDAELQAALDAARPGDEVRLTGGRYRGGLAHGALQGEPERPIVITAQDPDDPPVIDGGGSGWQLSSPRHVIIDGLVFERAAGNGLNIDDGGDVETPARDVTIRNVVVRRVGPQGNCDGIKLSGVDDFRVEDCRIEQWGTGGSAIDMVGCHDGVIRGCTFVGPGGEQANGVQTKGGSSDVVVERCRFERCGGRGVNIGGSTGLPFFRPRDAGYEASRITVQDCEFLGAAAAVAFVGVDGAVVKHNTIHRPEHWAVRILQETTGERFAPCRNGRFEKNVVVFHSDEMRTAVNVGDGTEPESFTFAGNVWHCEDQPESTLRFVQLPVAEHDGVYDRAARATDDAGVREEVAASAGSTR
jgi:hypothetical protein